MNADQLESEMLHNECLVLEKHLKFVRYEIVSKERGRQVFGQTENLVEIDQALQDLSTESVLVLCNLATKPPIENFLNVNRGRAETKLFVLLNAFFFVNTSETLTKQVIQWNVTNNTSYVKAILNFYISHNLKAQAIAVNKFIKLLGEEHGGIKYSISFHIRRTTRTTDQKLEKEFEKLILQSILSLYRSGVNITYLDLRIDSISHEQLWRELEEENRFRKITYGAQIKLRDGSSNFSIELAHRYLASTPHVDSQLQLPTDVHGDFSFPGLERIVILLVNRINFESTWVSNGAYLQLESFPDAVGKILSKCRRHTSLKLLDFEFMNSSGFKRKYTDTETNGLFKSLKNEISHFPEIKLITINEEDATRFAGGYELFEGIAKQKAPTSEAVVEFKKIKKFDCFIAHEWGTEESGFSTHEVAKDLKTKFEENGLTVWLDDSELTDNVVVDITYGVDNSAAMIILLTSRYFERGRNVNTNACKEFLYATRRKEVEDFIPLVLERKLLNPKEWFGPVAHQLPAKLYYDFSSEEAKNKNLPKVLAKIKKIHNKLA